MPDSGTTSRARLTRERVVAAAVSLADENGIESLSMRGLAKAFGVEAMSLYHHVANREAVLDGMVDLVFSEIQVPEAHEDWQTAMRDRAHWARAALTRHPWAVGLMDSRRSPGPATLRHYDAVLGCLRGGGLSLEMAGHAVAAIDAYVYGSVLQELSLPFEPGEEMEEMAVEVVEALPVDEYPHLIEFVRDRVLTAGYDFSDEFNYGLDLLLQGLMNASEGEPQSG